LSQALQILPRLHWGSPFLMNVSVLLPQHHEYAK
jgi:hypothetical protein